MHINTHIYTYISQRLINNSISVNATNKFDRLLFFLRISWPIIKPYTSNYFHRRKKICFGKYFTFFAPGRGKTSRSVWRSIVYIFSFFKRQRIPKGIDLWYISPPPLLHTNSPKPFHPKPLHSKHDSYRHSITNIFVYIWPLKFTFPMQMDLSLFA